MALNMKRNVPFGLYLGFHWRGFHENNIVRNIRMRCKRCFCDRSVINGAEHEQQRTIWPVSRLPLGDFHENNVVHNTRMRSKQCFCDRSVISGAEHEKQRAILSISASIGELFMKIHVAPDTRSLCDVSVVEIGR